MEVNSNPFSINQLLNDAVLRGDVALLQELLQRDPNDMACKVGHVQFTWELLRLNASLAEEVDPNDKSTPLHVASRNGHVELVRFLISISPGTCFTRDMNGMNPVHVAAVKGHLHVLDEMLRVMPAAAREKAGPVGESIMHLCVKYKQVKALEAVTGMVGGAEMLNAADGEGNTVLHVAVANKQLEIVRFLLSDRRVKRNTPNSMGFTPMDLFTQANKDPTKDDQLKLTLEGFKALQSDAIKKEKEKNRHIDWLESQRSALMVVASLIATMAFQAGLARHKQHRHNWHRHHGSTRQRRLQQISHSQYLGVSCVYEQYTFSYKRVTMDAVFRGGDYGGDVGGYNGYDIRLWSGVVRHDA